MPPPRRRPRRLGLLDGLIAATLLLAPLAGGTRAVREPSASPAARAARSFLAVDALDRAVAGPRAEGAAPIPPGSGLLQTPDGMANHRVFVDGLARGTGGDVLQLRCGPHAVRLGSAGRLQWVAIPCGATVRVER